MLAGEKAFQPASNNTVSNWMALKREFFSISLASSIVGKDRRGKRGLPLAIYLQSWLALAEQANLRTRQELDC